MHVRRAEINFNMSSSICLSLLCIFAISNDTLSVDHDRDAFSTKVNSTQPPRQVFKVPGWFYHFSFVLLHVNMRPYNSESTPTPPSSSISQGNDLVGISSQTVPSSGLFLPSPSDSSHSFSFGSPDGEQFQPSTLPAPSTKLSPMFVDRITCESNLSKPQHAELQKMLAV